MLLHWAPRNAYEDIIENGLRTLETLPPDSPHKRKYLGRAGNKTVEEYLIEKRGPAALRCVSAFAVFPPLAEVNDGIRRFCSRRQLYGIDYEKLLADGMVEQAWIVASRLGFSLEVPPEQAEHILRSVSDEADYKTKRKLIFSGYPHTIFAVRKGIVPFDGYLSLENRLCERESEKKLFM